LIPYFFGLSTVSKSSRCLFPGLICFQIVTPCGGPCFGIHPRLNRQRCCRFRFHIKHPRLRAPFLIPASRDLTRNKPVRSGCRRRARIRSWWLDSPRYTAPQFHSDRRPRCLGGGHHRPLPV
jgi:hypothetical protein